MTNRAPHSELFVSLVESRSSGRSTLLLMLLELAARSNSHMISIQNRAARYDPRSYAIRIQFGGSLLCVLSAGQAWLEMCNCGCGP